jgi:hypothetical protein
VPNDDDHERILHALENWISSKESQSARVTASQGGNRDTVLGGKHLAGINEMIVEELQRAGLDGLRLGFDRNATLPGYYRASKSWDLLAMRDDGAPVLAVEYKSMKGSEGKNLNNRADEVFGIAEDLRLAQEHGLVREGLVRAYIFIMEVTPSVTKPIRINVAVGQPDPIFDGKTYLQRLAIMCERIRTAGLYDLTWAIGVKTNPTEYVELSPETGWDQFKEGLWQVGATS